MPEIIEVPIDAGLFKSIERHLKKAKKAGLYPADFTVHDFANAVVRQSLAEHRAETQARAVNQILGATRAKKRVRVSPIRARVGHA